MTRVHAPGRRVRDPMDARVRLDGVGRRYGLRGPWVLRGVDLEVPAGTLLRIEGVNGSGKSTLLRLLAGIDAPTEGRLAGRPRTAYVPERFPAQMPFTAGAYLVHLGRVHGLSRTAAARGAARWLERFGAAQHLRTPLSELSKGSSQKVAVVQALLAEPELLLLDEAWTGLDTSARAELDAAVLERAATGSSVVFVDHDPGRLAGLPDATYALADGTLHRRAAGAAVPHVTIEALAPPGTDPAAPPPGIPAPIVRTASGAVRLTVSGSDSDGVLRGLLTARPPWHVVSVTPTRTAFVPAAAPPPAASQASIPAAGTAGTGTATGPRTISATPVPAPVDGERARVPGPSDGGDA